ncbi:MAG: DUF2934 domain-containing protein [Terriglobales bacterium]|jgi:hypothetical protein
MISAKNQETPQPTVVVNPKTSPGKLAIMPDAVPSDSKIRERAYELYENRGREPGQEEQDWFRAEREILNR